MLKNKIFLFVVVIGLIAGGTYLGYQQGIRVGEKTNLATPPNGISNATSGMPANVDFSIFWETWRQVEANFLKKDKIDYQKMVYGAISGMVASLGDPYTTFFTPTQSEEFKQELSGEYEGIGMVIGIKNGQIVGISPFKNSPAYNAGLKAGDKILKIGDKYTLDLAVDEAARLIRGQSGTEVTLLIDREGFNEPKEFKIKRQVIQIPTLELEIKDNVAVIKIYQFNEILTREFEKTARQLLSDSSIKNIVIDLRNNPGGYLEVANNVAGWFIDKGKTVVIQEGSDKNDRKIYKSEGPSVLKSYPVIVLINEGSASASEILAGALRDQNQSKLVGTKSFGKGSVQEQINLSNEASLKVTISHWLTPNENLIDEIGLEPDVKVEQSTSTTDDLQLQKALELLK